jgi:hypothetical protein
MKMMPVGGFDGLVLGIPLDAAPPPRPQPKPTPQQQDDEALQDEALYNALYSQQT